MDKNVWSQIKSVTRLEFIDALSKDGYEETGKRGADRGFRHSITGKYIVIHFHSKKPFGRDTLKMLLNDLGWMEKDLRRLKLIR